MEASLDWLNVFTPGVAAVDPELFSGRTVEIERLATELHLGGLCHAIVGDAGLGKTSLAHQATRIAMGDTALLERLGLARLRFTRAESFNVLWCDCSTIDGGLEQLLHRLVDALLGIRAERVRAARTGWISELLEDAADMDDDAWRLVDSIGGRKINSVLLSERDAQRFYLEPVSGTAIGAQFQRLTRQLQQQTGCRTLVVLDEVDRLASTAGLAKFIRSASGPMLKFMLVGITSEVEDLLEDHASIERLLRPVPVGRMDLSELRNIVARAAYKLLARRVNMGFEDSVPMRLAELARGYPWFVHVLGQEALINAHRRDSTEVDVPDMADALASLMDGALGAQYERSYAKAAATLEREIVLHIFAAHEERYIDTWMAVEQVRAIDEVRVNNPELAWSELCGPVGGSVLQALGSDGALTVFSNEMFKTYVGYRAPLHQEVPFGPRQKDLLTLDYVRSKDFWADAEEWDRSWAQLNASRRPKPN